MHSAQRHFCDREQQHGYRGGQRGRARADSSYREGGCDLGGELNPKRRGKEGCFVGLAADVSERPDEVLPAGHRGLFIRQLSGEMPVDGVLDVLWPDAVAAQDFGLLILVGWERRTVLAAPDRADPAARATDA
jgi:hypothetical protein